jgi:hypothetical protein
MCYGSTRPRRSHLLTAERQRSPNRQYGSGEFTVVQRCPGRRSGAAPTLRCPFASKGRAGLAEQSNSGSPCKAAEGHDAHRDRLTGSAVAASDGRKALISRGLDTNAAETLPSFNDLPYVESCPGIHPRTLTEVALGPTDRKVSLTSRLRRPQPDPHDHRRQCMRTQNLHCHPGVHIQLDQQRRARRRVECTDTTGTPAPTARSLNLRWKFLGSIGSPCRLDNYKSGVVRARLAGLDLDQTPMWSDRR